MNTLTCKTVTVYASPAAALNDAERRPMKATWYNQGARLYAVGDWHDLPAHTAGHWREISIAALAAHATTNTPQPFNESRESQDDYCSACAYSGLCNVILFDGEDCGDRAEAIPEGLTPEDWDALTPAEKDTARGLDELTSLPDPDDEEAADFDAQVRECLAHWPGIEPVELTDDPRRSGIYIHQVGGQPGHTVYGDWDK